MRRRSLAVVLALSVGLVACGDDDGSGEADGQTTTGDNGGEGVSFVDRLELVPMSAVEVNGDDARLWVRMADLDRAAELAGVEPPEGIVDPRAIVDYHSALTGTGALDEQHPPSVAALLPEVWDPVRVASDLDEFVDEVGWSPLDVSWFVEYPDPPGRYTVLGGDFEEASLIEAMGEPDEEIWRLGEEDLGQELGDHSVARPLGESLRLALDDDRLIVGRATPPVEDALDGGGETLADNQVFRSLAESLHREEVYSAIIGNPSVFGVLRAPPGILGDEEADAEDVRSNMETWADAEVLPEPFVGLAGGLAHEDGEAVLVLVYEHLDGASAEANGGAVERMVEQGESLQFEQPWSEILSVEDIRVDDTTLVARSASPPIAARRSSMTRSSSEVTPLSPSGE